MNKYEEFSMNFGEQLKKAALFSIEHRDEMIKSKEDKIFKSGYMLGLHRAITLLLKEAELSKIDSIAGMTRIAAKM